MIFNHRIFFAMALLVLAPVGCKKEPAPQRPPDPEIDEIKALLRELDEKPTLAKAMGSDAAVDLDSLPAHIAVAEVLEVPVAEPAVEAGPAERREQPVRVTRPLSPTAGVGQVHSAAETFDPVLACLGLYGACAGKGFTTDVCVRDLPRCPANAAPVKGGKACCPAECAESYARNRRHGVTVDAAGMAVFSTEADGCLLALSKAAEEPVPAEATAPPVEQGEEKQAPAPEPPAPAPPPVAPPKPAALVPAAPPARVSPGGLPSVGETAPSAVKSQPVP